MVAELGVTTFAGVGLTMSGGCSQGDRGGIGPLDARGQPVQDARQTPRLVAGAAELGLIRPGGYGRDVGSGATEWVNSLPLCMTRSDHFRDCRR